MPPRIGLAYVAKRCHQLVQWSAKSPLSRVPSNRPPARAFDPLLCWPRSQVLGLPTDHERFCVAANK